MSNHLKDLTAAGVSIWLDDLSRDRIESGNLSDLIAKSEVVGVTTNPSIFASALSKGDRYDAQVAELAAKGTRTDEAILELTTTDVRNACDLMRAVHEASHHEDGRVSIEVPPDLANDIPGTVAMTRRLVRMVDRPNVMIKIPATEAGYQAIADAVAEGIDINVTLIFGLDQYRSVIDAYFTGLERAAAGGKDLSQIHSVASLFVSRMDTEVDKRLEQSNGPTELLGKAGVANARLAYEAYEESLATQRWQDLAAKGANPQRPLWASTGVKNPSYPDTMYVMDLVVEDTVNTMPEATMAAVQDHGTVQGDQVRPHYSEAHEVMDALESAGIDYDDVIATLLREGLEKFDIAWEDVQTRVSKALARHGGEQS
jgi:transaldolase